MTFAAAVESAVAKVAPVAGVSIGRRSDRSTWLIDFRADATEMQIAAAMLVLRDFDILSVARADAISAIEQAAAAQHRLSGSVYEGQDARWLSKAEDAARWRIGDPSATARLQLEADAVGQSVGVLVSTIEMQREVMKMRVAQIEAHRRGGRKAVETTTDEVTLGAVRDAYISKIEGIS